MKVLHLVHWPRSGIGVVVRDLVTHRSHDIEHVVMSLTPGKPVTDQIVAAGAKVHEPSRPLSWPASAATLKKLMRCEQIDLIHSHSLTPRVLAALSAAGKPHVTTVHATYPYFRGRGIRNALKRALDCFAAARLAGPVVCVSEKVKSDLPCLPMAFRAAVIMNGVDLERVRIAAGQGRVELDGDPQLIALGRLDREKYFDRLLTAVASVRDQLPRIGLVICGAGAERDSLETQARNLGLSDTVRFAGHLSNPMPYVRAADAFISSSIQEGCSLSAAEAMALERPVIATAGISYLRDGETAILAAGFEPTDIARAIVRAFSDEGQLRRVAGAGRQFAETHFDMRRVASAYEDLYRQAIRDQRQGTREPTLMQA